MAVKRDPRVTVMHQLERQPLQITAGQKTAQRYHQEDTSDRGPEVSKHTTTVGRFLKSTGDGQVHRKLCKQKKDYGKQKLVKERKCNHSTLHGSTTQHIYRPLHSNYTIQYYDLLSWEVSNEDRKELEDDRGNRDEIKLNPYLPKTEIQR